MNTAIFSQINDFWNIKKEEEPTEISKFSGDNIEEDNENSSIICSLSSCKNCGSDNMIKDYEDGIIVCMDCSSIREEQMLDVRSDKNNYADKQDNSHYGGNINPLLPKSSLGTVIIGKGNNMLKKIHNWTAMPYKERSLWKVFEDIQNKCNKNDLPQCIADKAKEYYKVMTERRICRGRINEGVKASCIFFACKSKGVPRSDKECADIYNIQLKDFYCGYKEFTYHMNSYLSTKDITVINSCDLIPRFCNKLMIPDNITTLIADVSKRIEKFKLLNGNTPQSAVGGTISFVCDTIGYNINKYNIATICNISPMTLTKIQNKLEENKNNLIRIKEIHI